MKKQKDKKDGSNNIATLRDFAWQCLDKWRWFAGSVIVCVGIVAIHLFITPKTYKRDATIMIKPDDNRRSSSFTSQLQNMGNLDLFGTVSDVQNEILCIQSNSIMLETVKRLHLDYTYSSKKVLADKGILYGSNLPVEVEFEDIRPEQGITMTLEIKNEKITIADLQTSIDGEEVEDDNEYVCIPDSAVQTSVGAVRVHQRQQELADQTIYVTRNGYYGTVKRFKSELSFSLANKQAALINMSCEDYVPARAEDILNTIILVYNESWVRDKNLLAVSTSDFINERIHVIENELGTVDKDISSFKSENNMTDVAIAATQDVAQTTGSENLIRQYTNQLFMVRYIRNYMTQDNESYNLLPTGLGLSDNALNSQIETYNSRLLQRDNIARHSSSTSPLVKEINSELATMHSTILVGLDNEKVRLEQLILAEQGNQNKYAGRISKAPTLERDLRSIERQQEVKEALYLFLLQKREENELNQAFTAYNTRIVDTPYGGFAPVAPKSGSLLLLALLIGLFLPLNIIYMIMLFNTSVRGRKDLDNMATPFVGEIPLHHHKKGTEVKENALVVRANSRNVIDEAFRVVRTNLEFMLGNEQHKTVIVTSFNPGSGKTFVSANLAAAMSVKGKRVVVIDLDMRHASLSKFIGKPKQGISDYLAGYAEECPVVRYPEQENLSIIPVGTTPPNPTELLSNGRLETLIEKLKAEYDYIFLDCPPMEIVADTKIVARVADKTLFVVRAKLLERDMLPEIDNYYNQNVLPDMAVLLNGTEEVSHHYGYRYGYRYHYGYNYGYYHNYYSED